MKTFFVDKIDYSVSDLSNTIFKNIQAYYGESPLNFTRSDFRGSKFSNCIFRKNLFDRADFIDVVFEDVSFTAVDFGMSLIKNSYFNNVMFNANVYNNVAVQDCVFNNCHFNDPHLLLTLYNCKFINCTFSNAKFDHSAIDTNEFIECNFIKCKIAECHMENIKYSGCTLHNVELGSEYISSYMFKNTDLSKIQIKYHGKAIDISSIPVQVLDDLYDDERYFNYINFYIVINSFGDSKSSNNQNSIYENLVRTIEKTLQARSMVRRFNLKNIMSMLDFYYASDVIGYSLFQKIICYLNSINTTSLPIDERLDFESSLYRINRKNDLANTPIQYIIDSNDIDINCLVTLHIDSNNQDDAVSEVHSLFSTINHDILFDLIPKENIYKIEDVKHGSIILVISSCLLVAALAGKVIKSIHHDIQEMRVEKATADKAIENIKKAKTYEKTLKIKEQANKEMANSEKGFSNAILKLSNSILIGEIISMVITILF